MTTPSFEQGPIRPPSEAHSLLIRVIRNCTWNRCTFCPVYKGTKSSLRPVDEVLADVDAMAAAAEVLRRRGVHAVREGLVPPEAYQVSLFLGDGARAVFLQDADPCAVKPERLAAVVRRARERFPSVERVTTYGRAGTLARRAPDDLALLADAGLTRVHLGLESGADEVLMAVDKGCTSGDLIAAGRRVLEAGLELCFYLMPGLGGRADAAVHVEGSARVIREVAWSAPPLNPPVVRL
ncbi:MAG: radical SAM protein, partial [Actinobacteria bacterium]|nr:radical SAM protein [Actinomycetota bacterium]